MKIQPAQSVIARSVLTLIFTISLGVALIAQDASEEPSESVLKEETTAEESADTGNTEPKEFTPPTVSYTHLTLPTTPYV